MTRGNLDPQQIQVKRRQGNASVIQMFGGGSPLVNEISIYDANGNLVSSGRTIASIGGALLKTNSVNNGSQTILNLKNGSNITIADDGVGGITITASGGLLIKTNGTNNASQTVLNLQNGAGIVITDNGSGNISIAISSPSDSTKYLDGSATPTFKQVRDSDLSLTNITTNNVSTSRHGFAPILPNDATKFLDGTGGFTAPSLGATASIQVNGSNVGNAAITPGVYDVTFSYPGSPPNSRIFNLLISPRNLTFAANFVGSYGYCSTNPSVGVSYSVYQNGVLCGTVSISTSGVFTFSTVGGAVLSFVAGDKLSILTPATDLSLADVAMTFAGVRT